MKKKLLLLEINEFDLKYFLKGAKKFNFFEIIDFFKNKKKLKTYTKDKQEGYNLDPWVQWVSVHTGKTSNQHKVYRIGQTLSSSVKQIWEMLADLNFKSTIWGAFNSTLRKKKNIDLFYPDPWSFSEKAFPKNFNSYLKLPSYYAQNYPSVKKTKLIYYCFIFLVKIFFSRIFFYLIKNFFSFFKIFLKVGIKSFNLYFFLDLISLLIIQKNIKKSKSDFVIISLNSFAHYQHNFWDEKKYEHIYFWYLNEMIKVFNNMEKIYNSSIVFNGFSQRKIKTEYHLRAKDPQFFLSLFNLRYKNIKPNMTTGATVFFKDAKDKIKTINFLKSISIYDYPLFEIQNFNKKNKIFFKFSLVSYKIIDDINTINISNYKKYFQKPKIVKKTKNIQSNNLLKIIFSNIIYMKSTSRHLREGDLFYKKFNFLNRDKKKGIINNKHIFRNILIHFKD